MNSGIKKSFLTLIVIIAVALTALFAINNVNVSTNLGQAMATHGQNIGRTVPNNVTEVSNAEDLQEALRAGESVALTNNITLNTTQAFVDIYSSTSSGYTGQVYGQGYTLTVNGNNGTGETTQSNNKSFTVVSGNTAWGAVLGNLGNGGAIYDLNVVINNRIARGPTSGTDNVYVGGIVGQMSNGSRIENCAVTINQNAELFAFCWSAPSNADAYPASGGIAGCVYNGATILNCTVTNNGVIKGAQGVNAGSANQTAYGDTTQGAGGNIAGIFYNSSAITVNNIVTKGSGKVFGRCASNIGMTRPTSSSSIGAISIQNFSSSFSGTYEAGYFASSSNRGYSYGIFRFYTGDGSSITNFYRTSNLTTSQNNSTYSASITRTLTIDDYEISFDPSASNTANSLKVKSKQQISASSLAVVSTQVASNTYIGYLDDGYAVFEGLPTDITTYGSQFTLSISTTQITPEKALNSYEDGYVATSSSEGVAITNSDEFGSVVAGGLNGYLTQDIVLTEFSDKDFYGTIDGNGHTVYIYIPSGTVSKDWAFGGLVGKLYGTIKNLRVVLCNSITVPTGSNVIRFGLVAGRLFDGSRVENVNAVLRENVTISINAGGYNANVGLIAGHIEYSQVTLKDVTVRLDGALDVRGAYVFESAVIGSNKGDNTLNFENIIILGDGSIKGDASNTNRAEEQLFTSGLIILQSTQNEGMPQVNINGLIYGFTGEVANNGTDTMTALSMFGVVAINDAYNYWTVGDTSRFTVSNYLKFDNATAETKMEDGFANNTFAPISQSLKTIKSSVENRENIKVSAYLVGDNVIFGMGDGTANYWTTGAGSSLTGNGLITKIATNKYYETTEGQNKYISFPKTDVANITDTVQVSEWFEVSAQLKSNTTYTYTGLPIDVQLTTTCVDTNFTADDLSIQYAVKEDANNNASLQNGKPLNAGTYTVTVDLTDNYYYADKTQSKTFEMTVLPQEITVQQTNLTITYGESGYTEDAIAETIKTALSLPANVDLTTSFSSNDFSASGNLKYKEGGYALTFAPSNANYTLSQSAGTLTVNKKTATVTVNLNEGATITYGDSVDTVKGLVSTQSSGFVGTADCQITPKVEKEDYQGTTNANSTVTFDVVVTATDGNENYSISYTNDISLTVQKKTVSLSSTEISKPYGTVLQNQIESALGDIITGEANGEVAKYTAQITDETYSSENYLKVNENGYSVLITLTGDNYTFAQENNTVTLKITNTLNSETTLDNFTYGTLTAQNWEDTIKEAIQTELSIESEIVLSHSLTEAFSTGNALNVNANYSVNATVSDSGEYTTVKFGVTEKEISISISDSLTATYNGQTITLPTVSSNEIVNGDNVILSLSSSEIKNVDTYPITLQVTGTDESNYLITLDKSYSYVVTKATLQLSASSISKSYGDVTAQNWQEIIKQQVLLNGQNNETFNNYTLTCEAISSQEGNIEANRYTVSVSLTGEQNYNDFSGELEFVVSSLNVNVGTISPITYGDVTVASFASYVEGLNLITTEDGENVNYTVSCGAISSSSSVYIPANESGYSLILTLDGNYSQETVQITWVVNKLNVTVTVSAEENFSITYGDESTAVNQKLSASVTTGDFKSSETFTLTAMAGDNAYSSTTQAGTKVTVKVDIELPANDSLDNYEIVFVNDIAEVVQKQIISVDEIDLSAIYGQAGYTKEEIENTILEAVSNANITLTNEFLDEDFSSTGFLKVKAEPYVLTFAPIDDTNYALSETQGALTINKAKVNIGITLAENASITYGDSLETVLALLNIDKQNDVANSWINLENITVTTTAKVDGEDYSALVDANKSVVLAVNALAVDGNENYQITITYPDGNENITLVVQQKQISLDKQSITATYGQQEISKDSLKTYLEGQSLVSIDYQVETDSLPFNQNNNLNANPTGYSITITLTDDNYALTNNVVSLIVEPKELTLNTESEIELTYGDENATKQNIQKEVIKLIAGIESGDQLMIDITGLAERNYISAGSHNLNITISNDSNANYATLEGTISLQVGKKTITVSLPSNTAPYTGDVIKVEIIEPQLVGDDAVSFKINADRELKEEGEYTLSLSATGEDAENYIFTLANGTFTITHVTIVPNEQLEGVEVVQDNNSLLFKIAIKPNDSGYETSENIIATLKSLQLVKNSSGEVVDYNIEMQSANFTNGGRLSAGKAVYLATITSGDDYELKTFTVEIDVAKIDIVINFENQYTYTGEQIHIVPTTEGSVLHGDAVSYQCSFGVLKDAGTYPVTLTVQGDDKDSYNFILAHENVVISPANANITLSQNEVTIDSFKGFGSGNGLFDPLSVVSAVKTDDNTEILDAQFEYVIEGLEEGQEPQLNTPYTVVIKLNNNNYTGQASYQLTISSMATQEPTAPEDSNWWIYVAIGGGVLLLLIILIIIIVVVKKKKHKKENLDL